MILMLIIVLGACALSYLIMMTSEIIKSMKEFKYINFSFLLISMSILVGINMIAAIYYEKYIGIKNKCPEYELIQEQVYRLK